jgi:hypothetical protein
MQRYLLNMDCLVARTSCKRFWNSGAVVSILWSANLLHAQLVRDLSKGVNWFLQEPRYCCCWITQQILLPSYNCMIVSSGQFLYYYIYSLTLQNTLYCLIKDPVHLPLFFYKLCHFNAFALLFIPSTEKMKWRRKVLHIKKTGSPFATLHMPCCPGVYEKHMLTFCW